MQLPELGQTTLTRLGRRFYAGAVLIAYWGLLFLATHMPAIGSTTSVPHADKIFHFWAYVGLAVLLCWYRAGDTPLTGKLARQLACVLVVYGFVDEISQYPIAGRSPDAWDWAADVAGALMGVALFAIVLPRVLKWRTLLW